MKMYYIVGNKRYLDNYMIRQQLTISKSLFQQLTRKYIKSDEVIKVQNKHLYSIESILDGLKKVVKENGCSR
jgi:hypothetical protein